MRKVSIKRFVITGLILGLWWALCPLWVPTADSTRAPLFFLDGLIAGFCFGAVVAALIFYKNMKRND